MNYRIFETENQIDGSQVEKEVIGQDLDAFRPAPNGGVEKMDIGIGGGCVWIIWIDVSRNCRVEWDMEE